MYKAFIKPLLDVVFAFIGLVVLSPVILLVMLLLMIANKGNPFFVQQRPGKCGRLFNVIKFKTMNDRRDVHGELLPDSERLTPFGKLVRKTSLDELPQMWNVLMGDMSFVGPRPLLPEYLPLYNSRQRRRHEVKPGITGWAQVNGRNAISWDQKFELDIWYVDHLNAALDAKIIWMTLRKTIKAEGINSATSATMEKFAGSNQ